ncbi:MAG: helix-turn-helix domain-containing protein [bacterium]
MPVLSSEPETLSQPWSLTEIPVKPAFIDFVGTLFYLRFPKVSSISPRRIIAMAGPSTDLLLNLGSPFVLETFYDSVQVDTGSCLAGPRPATSFIRHEGELLVLGARFRHGAAASLLPYPVKELEQRVIPLNSIWPEVARVLASAGTRNSPPQELIGTMETALAALLSNARKPDPMIRKAVRLMAEHQGDLEISALATELGVSRQTVKHKFDQHIGVSPKLFAKLRRFQTVLGRLSNGNKTNWTDLAKETGYYDQAHLTREFNHFTGFSPQKFVKNLEKGEDLYLFDNADQTRYYLDLRQDALESRAAKAR